MYKSSLCVMAVAAIAGMVCGDEMSGVNVVDMVFVEGGTYIGKDSGVVTVGDFHIGKYEVTQGLWNAVSSRRSNPNPSYFKGDDNLPVEMVNWMDVQEFIKRLNRKTGKNYRLPTEEEWEYAARGGNVSKGYKHSGSDDIDEVAWYRRNSGGRTHRFGAKKPNELGIHDMSGNVMEWMGTEPVADLDYTTVYRGGGYDDVALLCRISYRFSITPVFRSRTLGFRLAHSVEGMSANPAGAPATSPQGVNSDLDSIAMIFVKGGTFKVRCAAELSVCDCRAERRGYDAPPEHSVTVKDFSIGKYEITQKLWTNIMGANPSEFRGDNLPVEQVSYYDVQEFIRKLNAKTGRKYRLPTEAEWEYAARGGDRSKGFKYSGSDDVDNVAWWPGNSDRETHPVGTKQANELWIHDMSGNVWEWTNDVCNVENKGVSSNRVVYRGGGYGNNLSDEGLSPSVSRSYAPPGWKASFLGFRLATD